MLPTVERDEYLWTRLQNGCEKALSNIFLLYSETLFEFGCLLCQDKEKVEDCLQDLFFQLWQNHRKLGSVNCIKTYLLIALRNKIQSTFRLRSSVNIQQIEETYLNIDYSIEDTWINQEMEMDRQAIIHKALQALPHRMKQVIYLRYFENMDYGDIAKIMSIQKQVAINMVHRAITHLRKHSKSMSESLMLIFLMTWTFV